MELAYQPKHCAPPERGTIGQASDYKHLAPLERKQFPVLHFVAADHAWDYDLVACIVQCQMRNEK